MITNEWITDRLPTDEDCKSGLYVVYNALGRLEHICTIKEGEAWKPLPECEPCVKPKRFEVLNDAEGWYISEISTGEVATPLLSTREDAKEIAAIFERAAL